MIASSVRPLPQGFSLVVATSGLRLSVVSGPDIAPAGTAGNTAYLVELRHGDDLLPLARFPLTPATAPRTVSDVTLVDVLFAVAGDILATQRAHGGAAYGAATLWVPAERIADIATALERAIGPWRYRVLLAAYEAEEREGLTVLAAGFAGPNRPPPGRGGRRSRRDPSAHEAAARRADTLRGLTDAWNAVRQSTDDHDRAEALLSTGESLLALGLSDAAADAFRAALRSATSADDAVLRSRALIGQMAVAAATGREALFEWFRQTIPTSVLGPAVRARYKATAEEGIARFGRATDAVDHQALCVLSAGEFTDTSVVQTLTERAVRSLATETISSSPRGRQRSLSPEVAPVVRALRAMAQRDRARGPGRGVAALARTLSRGLADASAAATHERLEHPRWTARDRETVDVRWIGAPAELEMTLHAAQYARAVRAALAAGDVAWGGTAWLLGALEAAQHFGYALADSGAPAAADAWFHALEQTTAPVAPEFAAHVLTWRAGLARRAGRWAEADQLRELASRQAARLNDGLLSLAVGKADAQALLAVGNLGDAEAAFCGLLARSERGAVRSSGLTVVLLNDLAVTLERRADTTEDPTRRSERLIEAAELFARALAFGPGVLRSGQREFLVHNLGYCCVALGYLDTADRAFDAVVRSAPSDSFRAAAIVAGALTGRIDLAVRRGDRHAFARWAVEARGRWMEPRERGIALLASLRGAQRFAARDDSARARSELETFARQHRFSDLLAAVAAERTLLDGSLEAVAGPAGDGAVFVQTVRDGQSIDTTIAAAIGALSRAADPIRATPCVRRTTGPSAIVASPYRGLWRAATRTASLFAAPAAPDALRGAPELIRAALAEFAADSPRTPHGDTPLLDAIRGYGDALGSLRAYREACAWFSVAMRAGREAQDAALAGWALAWRAGKRRQGVRSGRAAEACWAAERDYDASLGLALTAGLRELALFARHGLGAVALTRGRTADAMARLTPLASYARALGSRRVLAGVLNDLGTATYRVALTLDERDAIREYARSAEWYTRAVEVGQELLLPIQRDILLLNLGGASSALGLHSSAAAAADFLFRTTAKDEHRTGAAVLHLRTAGACCVAEEVDRWVTWLDTRHVGPRQRAEILIATGRAYRMLGRVVAARTVLHEAVQVARVVPGRELTLVVRRELAQLTAGSMGPARGASANVPSGSLTGIAGDAIQELTRAPVGALADWE